MVAFLSQGIISTICAIKTLKNNKKNANTLIMFPQMNSARKGLNMAFTLHCDKTMAAAHTYNSIMSELENLLTSLLLTPIPILMGTSILNPGMEEADICPLILSGNKVWRLSLVLMRTRLSCPDVCFASSYLIQYFQMAYASCKSVRTTNNHAQLLRTHYKQFNHYVKGNEKYNP